VGSLLHSALVSDSYDTLLVLDLLQSLFLHDLSSESSHVSLIISVWCFILRSLIILRLWVIVVLWCCTLLCRIILLFPLKLLHIILWLCCKLLGRIVLWLLHSVILWLLRILSYYMFILHPICICNPFFHHLQGSTILVFMSN
jgi:hypothetical protein